VGVWREKSGQEAFPLARPGRRPLVSPGTSVAGDQMQISCRPVGARGGRGQEVRPVCFLGRGDGLKISSSRALHIAPVERGWAEAGYPCKLVILPSHRQ